MKLLDNHGFRSRFVARNGYRQAQKPKRGQVASYISWSKTARALVNTETAKKYSITFEMIKYKTEKMDLGQLLELRHDPEQSLYSLFEKDFYKM